MSILGSLKRLFDPMQHRVEEQERKRKREVRPADASGDDSYHVDLPPPREPERAQRICKHCDYRGDEPEYCPRCLAPSMEEAEALES